VAGLPNITGSVGDFGGEQTIYTQRGAFRANKVLSDFGGYGTTRASWNIDFNASNSNSIYGSSDTVTPLSESVVFCISY